MDGRHEPDLKIGFQRSERLEILVPLPTAAEGISAPITDPGCVGRKDPGPSGARYQMS